jgi:hypothetical protein
MKISLKEFDSIYPDIEIEFDDKGVDLVNGVYVTEFRFKDKIYFSKSSSVHGDKRVEDCKPVIKQIVEENNLAVVKVVDDMETIESLLGRRGRFVGDMVHISIKDLAECIREFKK